ncbi:hypothetical protein OXYTRIMIC_130 [Oxytricha trifallax]|uniref:Uncharacterized protein n=1 Tax=Oxytricha trifallax TaxID=1172189 RepID=A0A073I0W9_9SPIT|nr:hypothetical protein OXYTRIMIC_130 [Oxytricha trifallax]
MNQQVNFKLYRRETLVKILLKLELEAKKQKQQLSFNELINYTEDELLLSEKDLQLLGNQKNQTQGDLNQVDMFEDLNKQKKISKLKDCMHTEYERVANQIKMKSIKRVPKQNALSKVQNLEIQTKDYKSVLQEWDDDLMDIFHVQEATTHMQLLQQLQPIVHQIGFQVKIDEELQSKEVKLTPQEQINIYDIAIEAQCQFVKFGCAYPLKNCQFYLLYKMFSNGQTLLFACYLSHSHSMGPIPMPPELKPSGNINN